MTIFFYGLFMDPGSLEEKGLRPSAVRQAYLDGFALRLGERAALVRTRKGRVWGTIMTLTLGEVDRLYSEPSVAAYRPEPVLAHLLDGTAKLALCFNLPAPLEEGARNPQYAVALQAIARKMGLPARYVASIGGSRSRRRASETGEG